MRKPPPTVSCIIPTHERHELLRQSIASVVEQTFDEPFEIIVVDDSSDELTQNVVLEAQSQTLVPIKYAPRIGKNGASASRNFGAGLAKGELLAFLDDDDLWSEAFLEEAIEALNNSGADMAVTWLSILDLDGKVGPLYRMDANLDPARVAAKNSGFTGSNFVIRRAAFDSLSGFDPDLPVSNDKDFLLRFLLQRYSYVIAGSYLAIHRRHHGPQLTTGDERRARGVEAYMSKHEAVLDARGRRYLRKRIHRIRMRTAPTKLKRFRHAVRFFLCLSIDDLKSKWRRRDGRYSDLRA